MPRQRLRVIPKPAEGTRVVLKSPSKNPTIIRGEGDIDLLCGKCGATLVAGIHEGQVANVVLHCNQCDGYNDV